MYHNANFEPARPGDAAGWQMQMDLQHTMVADPLPAMAPYFAPFGRHNVILIDAQSMSIVSLSPNFTVPRFAELVENPLPAGP